MNANAISRVIGRGGNNINAIRELSGAHIEVEKQGKGVSAATQDRTILIKGQADATRLANQWINQIIANPDKDLSEIIGKPYRTWEKNPNAVGAANNASGAGGAGGAGLAPAPPPPPIISRYTRNHLSFKEKNQHSRSYSLTYGWIIIMSQKL